METFGVLGFDGLTEPGLRGRIDVRPTLLLALTDLYVQKPTHTLDEQRHYVELALRLLEAVDAPTRAAVAARLARHNAPPLPVIERLTRDLPEIAAQLHSPSLLRPPAIVSATTPARPNGERNPNAAVNVPGTIGADIARELNELFFAANADARRLILLHLDFIAPVPARRADISRDPLAGKRLEAAALARSRHGFAKQLTVLLQIPLRQALRIACDDLGEPIVVAAKVLNVPRELLYRILLFVNTAIGHSVERVHTLADLYDELPMPAAEDFVAMWQALKLDEHAAHKHRPLLWDDGQAVTTSRKLRPARSSTSTIQTSGSNLISRAR
jgi:hypothetical protein